MCDIWPAGDITRNDVLLMRRYGWEKHASNLKARTDSIHKRANDDKKGAEGTAMSRFWKWIIIDVIVKVIRKIVGGDKNELGKQNLQSPEGREENNGNKNAKV